jgi:hypothetical protein
MGHRGHVQKMEGTPIVPKTRLGVIIWIERIEIFRMWEALSPKFSTCLMRVLVNESIRVLNRLSELASLHPSSGR